ncbi:MULTISPECIES: DUF1284 domain-containing protein [unclassified Oceanispirochaeta]|uniref:DUF1284 domain-containing protein n=1 Tax=unclassified Oceanispirochaeta TaxID=2635722 RepID=UPI000E0951DA|nr:MULTISPECIES: DUF1284 domain-containing protein [unclassified Oceanispirochaeta]MBF9014870.1 DUF1284 domain-containing protein [Oceanispirochaeta sp. M2]NPD71449.1 DUF1284 domain-containing protein [Oceanispirochaeta sp. M1]RDG33410.1 DUF1284 domain-containing protein [Oceanispirochaeta sp. M1]
MQELRIHHFFDMLRDYGAKKEINPHDYGHSYHLIAEKIYSNKLDKIRLVISNDDVCKDCSKSEDGHCIDTISHRTDFSLKEDFNNHIDHRIMEKMKLKENEIISYEELLEKAEFYINEMDWIYEGNDPDHTEKRRENVIKGVLKTRSELNLV